MSHLKANKGEWSELYTLLKLLADQRLDAADADLQKLQGIFCPVCKIFTAHQTEAEVAYHLNNNSDIIKIYHPATASVTSINRGLIQSKLSSIFNAIKTAQHTTFAIDIADDLMEKLRCTKIQAS